MLSSVGIRGVMRIMNVNIHPYYCHVFTFLIKPLREGRASKNRSLTKGKLVIIILTSETVLTLVVHMLAVGIVGTQAVGMMLQ